MKQGNRDRRSAVRPAGGGALTNLVHAAGRLRDSRLQQRIQMADSIDAGGADVAVQLMGTEPVLKQKEGPIRGAASSKQGNLQQ